jgi:hypothetical protein
MYGLTSHAYTSGLMMTSTPLMKLQALSATLTSGKEGRKLGWGYRIERRRPCPEVMGTIPAFAYYNRNHSLVCVKRSLHTILQ